MKDIAFLPSYLDELWLPDFPQAEVLRLADADHYLQEDANEKIIPALMEFLLRTRGRPNSPVEAAE
jgi:hypothetical protein